MIIWADWKVDRLNVGGALITNGQPTVEHTKAEPKTVATKQFSCIIAPKSILFISTYLVRKKFTLDFIP